MNLTKMDFLVAERIYDSVSGVFYRRIHLHLEKIPRNLKRIVNFSNNKSVILEIGAGSGEHLGFVQNEFHRYVMSDISDFGLTKLKKKLVTDKIVFDIANVEFLPYQDASFDRVVATCVLAHVDEPFQAFSEIHRVLKEGGTASLFLSSEPSLFLRLLRSALVQGKMKELPMSYALYNAIAHRNSFSTLRLIAKEVFKNDYLHWSYFPFRLPIWNFSTHVILHLVKSKAQVPPSP